MIRPRSSALAPLLGCVCLAAPAQVSPALAPRLAEPAVEGSSVRVGPWLQAPPSEAVAATREVVVRGVEWLIVQQQVDGSWLANVGLDRHRAPEASRLATAAAVLVLIAECVRGGADPALVRAMTPARLAVDRGLRWLVEQIDATPVQIVEHPIAAPLEEQAFVMLTISEAYHFTRHRYLRTRVTRAAGVLEAMLDDPGVADRRDACALGLAILALDNAAAEVPVVRAVIAPAVRELDGGVVDAAPLRDAIALFAGFCIDDAELRAVERRVPNLIANPPVRGANFDAAYVYFATYALLASGTESWPAWRDTLATNIVAAQVRTGGLAGSWDPGDPRAQMRGRVWTTSLRVLATQLLWRRPPTPNKRRG